MNDADLYTEGPHGQKIRFEDITANLRRTLTGTERALAEHRFNLRGSLAHLSPSLLSPPMADEDRMLAVCEVCHNARNQIAYLNAQISNLKIDFITTTLERQEREQTA